MALAGIIISWIAPSFTGKYTRHRPIIFSHLLERLTALIILMFGETIVGIADYFPPASFSIYSLLIFVSVVSLFFTYIVEFDHLVEEKRTEETGNLMIYLHYFILFGISLFTVALKFISEESAQPLFTASCLYGGIFLFYIGLWLANRYNRIIINGWWVSSLPRPLRVSWQQVFGRRLPPLQSLSRSLPRPTPPA